MNLENLNNEFYELELRFDVLFLLSTVLVSDSSLPSELEDMIYDGDMDDFSSLGLAQEAEDWDKQEVIDWLIENKRFGWLCKAATPVRDYLDADSYSSSWSCYTTKWLYADDFDELLKRAKSWVAACDVNFKSRRLNKEVAA
ncbi:MAG: hypothetical protein K8H84_00085 [Sulfuricella denitrificans]|nr:hypothetical protein [Sulfuricella denitrificans]